MNIIWLIIGVAVILSTTYDILSTTLGRSEGRTWDDIFGPTDKV